MDKKRITIAAFRVSGLFLIIIQGISIIGSVMGFLSAILLKVNLAYIMNTLSILTIPFLLLVLGIILYSVASSMSSNYLLELDDGMNPVPVYFEYAIVSLLVSMSAVGTCLSNLSTLISFISQLAKVGNTSVEDIFVYNISKSASAIIMSVIQFAGGLIFFIRMKNKKEQQNNKA